ncbi:MAG: type I DNA topoisomerase [Desulfovibrio sp.]|nr:type I DNA topoisomerase [Desulfovibrio sp.]
MGKNLIIVESPAKVKTIRKFLGNAYAVHASVGHIRDLPSKTLGVDENNGFAPHYEIIPGKEKIVDALREAAAKADNVYLAPDPDREGEAIAWHIAALIEDGKKSIQRIQFNEITARAVKEALTHPRPLNANLFDAQQARRVLDRLVGYKISPLLWNKVKRGISAGRVQSVALRLLAERDAERRIFVPEEYWLFHIFLDAGSPPLFRADLHKVDGKKPKLNNEQDALAIESRISGKAFIVAGIESKERERTPPPPFITSTLQQSANQRLGYTAKRAMNIAQRLYEGVDLGEAGTTALITYMRTDSVRISDEAEAAAKAFIESTWGKDYYPRKARRFASKKGAQDAHEAIRPVDVAITPDSIRALLSPEQYQLYRLIWNRFLASRMADARVQDTTILIECDTVQFRTKGERVVFPGFYVLSPQKNDEAVELPSLAPDQPLTLASLEKEQKFTQPPPRYTEASLVRELEEKGIGRPSTYASIIATLLEREYAVLEDKHFAVTDLGGIVCRLLTENFQELMDVGFTAAMEERLDKVAEGEEDWITLISRFSKDFTPVLEKAAKTMDSVKGGMSSGLSCPECGKPALIKFGKAGAFLACSGYPACRFTSNFVRDDQGGVHIAEHTRPPQQLVGKCPDCDGDLVLKKARTGSRFIACTRYPDCRYARPYSTGVICPACQKGSLVEKSSKRGKLFFACDQYPQCDYAMWDEPVPGPCPACASPFLVLKRPRAGRPSVRCPEKKCDYRKDAAADSEKPA